MSYLSSLLIYLLFLAYLQQLGLGDVLILKNMIKLNFLVFECC